MLNQRPRTHVSASEPEWRSTACRRFPPGNSTTCPGSPRRNRLRTIGGGDVGGFYETDGRYFPSWRRRPGGAPARIISQWRANRAASGDVNAWMDANAANHAWNACAIVKGQKYVYFKKVFFNKFKKLKEISREAW